MCVGAAGAGQPLASFFFEFVRCRKAKLMADPGRNIAENQVMEMEE